MEVGNENKTNFRNFDGIGNGFRGSRLRRRQQQFFNVHNFNHRASDSASDTAGESAEASDTGSEDLEDIAQIEVMFWTLNTIPTDVDMVEEAINEITREKINTEVNLNIIEMGSYVQQFRDGRNGCRNCG